MQVASTVPAALASLTTLVQAQTATDAIASQILVCQGEVGMDAPNDIIQIGTSIRRNLRPNTLLGSYASGSLEETYDIEVLVSTWSGDPDPIAITNRAFLLAEDVESAVRTDPSLGTSVLEAHPAGTTGGNAEWTSEPVGRLCELTVTISVMTLN